MGQKAEVQQGSGGSAAACERLRAGMLADLRLAQGWQLRLRRCHLLAAHRPSLSHQMQRRVDLGDLELLGVELAADPLQQLLVLLMLRVADCFQEVGVAPDPSARRSMLTAG